MPGPLRFAITARSAASAARVGRLETLHGAVDTPAFIPVGTRGSVKGLSAADVRATGAQIVLANTYHLMLAPGSPLVAHLGGLHRFMGWDGPILTDSGGYQVYSLSDISSVTEEGVTFRSVIDGSYVHLGPAESMRVQNDLGADIIMAFDDCPPAGSGAERLRLAHERTIRWLERSVAAHARPGEQALFGIVQGGTDGALRRASAAAVCGIDLPGFAIGGVAVGESPQDIRRVVEATAPLLPAGRPRYLMGVGYERDLVMAVRAGVDLFDCVLPTRNGRNACAFTAAGRLRLRNARYRADGSVLEEGCDCPACAGGYSRAYLRHLFTVGEMLGPILTSAHNLRHFQRLMLDIRKVVRDDSWPRLYRSWPVLEQTDDSADRAGGPAGGREGGP